MTELLDQETSLMLSTHPDAEKVRVRFMEIMTSVTGKPWVDPLTPRYLERLQRQRKLQTYAVNNKPITTISYEVFGTTALWDFLLYINGYMHPDEIEPGAVILVPSDNVVEDLEALNDYKKATRGVTVIT